MGIKHDNRNPRDKLEPIEATYLILLLYVVYLSAFVYEISLNRSIKSNYSFIVFHLSIGANTQASNLSAQITRHGSSITTPPHATSEHF